MYFKQRVGNLWVTVCVWRKESEEIEIGRQGCSMYAIVGTWLMHLYKIIKKEHLQIA